MEQFLPKNRLVTWEYDEKKDDDDRFLACNKFMEDDYFVQTREFKEFIAELKAKEINERVRKAQGVDP